MLAGKIVPNLACECGCAFRAFVRADDDWRVPCPKCGEPVHESQKQHGHTTRFYGNRRFSESERVSRCQGFRPQEVEQARKLLPGFQHCIRDNGDVVFNDRKEERAFVKAQDAAFGATADPGRPVPQGIWGG